MELSDYTAELTNANGEAVITLTSSSSSSQHKIHYKTSSSNNDSSNEAKFAIDRGITEGQVDRVKRRLKHSAVLDRRESTRIARVIGAKGLCCFFFFFFFFLFHDDA